jgi:hypothetical protein
MIFSNLVRQLLRRPPIRTIDLIASDRMALGNKIRHLSAEQCASLNWSQQERDKLGEALMVRNPKGYDGWHPTDDELFTVILTESQWDMVERLCSDLVSAKSDGWPERVLSRIRANAV